jgi:hypothetical protein
MQKDRFFFEGSDANSILRCWQVAGPAEMARMLREWPGHILADEIGFGKTTHVLACIPLLIQ